MKCYPFLVRCGDMVCQENRLRDSTRISNTVQANKKMVYRSGNHKIKAKKQRITIEYNQM